MRAATTAWVELVGEDIDVRQATELRAEVLEYNTALRNLGGAADEIEQLRKDLADQAEPAVLDARRALAAACAPFGIDDADLGDGTSVDQAVDTAIERGRGARTQVELEAAESTEREAAQRLSDQLRQLGFDAGELDARVGALDWALARAAEREEARANARPRGRDRGRAGDARGDRPRAAPAGVVHGDRLRGRRPSTSTELEHRREEVRAQLSVVNPEVDVVRLADRHAALERRVIALEARHGGHDDDGDPGRGRRHPASPAGPPDQGGHGRPARRSAACAARRGAPAGAGRAQVGPARPAVPAVRAPPARVPERRRLRGGLGSAVPRRQRDAARTGARVRSSPRGQSSRRSWAR